MRMLSDISLKEKDRRAVEAAAARLARISHHGRADARNVMSRRSLWAAQGMQTVLSYMKIAPGTRPGARSGERRGLPPPSCAARGWWHPKERRGKPGGSLDAPADRLTPRRIALGRVETWRGGVG